LQRPFPVHAPWGLPQRAVSWPAPTRPDHRQSRVSAPAGLLVVPLLWNGRR